MPPLPSPTLVPVHWDRLFEDLEGQLAAEWETERAALDAEAERLRIARLDLRQRLRTLASIDAGVRLELAGAAHAVGRVQEVGSDWVAVGSPALTIVPIDAIRSIVLDHGLLLSSLDEGAAADGVRDRMSLGFVLRDLARRRAPVRLGCADGAVLHGTIDRAGADHLDLAEHEPGTVRRAADVRGFRIVAFTAVARIDLPTSS